jgi:tetratricopeptide (TPR) repeat protein
MKVIFQATICVGLVLCVICHGWATEEEEGLDVLSQEESEFHSPPSQDNETEIVPFDEDEERQFAPFNEEEEFRPSPSDDVMFEEDLPAEETFPSAAREQQPFPSEMGATPFAEEQPSFPALGEPSSLFPGDSAAPQVTPVPTETPPFMSRPSEWEATPPTVIDMPPLPSANLFADRELVALKFIEEGKTHFDREEWELAREQFERAISLAPLVPYSYYFLGRIAFAERDLKSALAFLQKAESLFPRTAQAWLGETTSRKGTVYEDLKDYKQARTAYRRSLRFEPANLKVLSALARLPEEESPLSDAILQ